MLTLYQIFDWVTAKRVSIAVDPEFHELLTVLLCLCSQLHPQGGESQLVVDPQGLPAEVSLCGKMEVLDRMLVKLIAAGHKVSASVSQSKYSYIFGDDWPSVQLSIQGKSISVLLPMSRHLALRLL